MKSKFEAEKVGVGVGVKSKPEAQWGSVRGSRARDSGTDPWEEKAKDGRGNTQASFKCVL